MATIFKALKNIASGNRPRKLHPPSFSDDSTELELLSLPNAIPKQYPPLILIHLILLSAAFVLLPQTPIPNLPISPPTRGLDKPQHPFLAPITTRPVLTLTWACLGAILLVPWWAGSLRQWAHNGTLGSRSVQERLEGDPHKQRDIWNASIFTVYTALALHGVIILFGAPFIQYVQHTALLALLLALYTTFPPAYVLGPPRLGLPFLSASASNAIVQNDLWVRIFAERNTRNPPERALLYPTYGAFLGAWCGVIPIGLDWDRPWQAYPLTPAAGASLGYITGALLALGANLLFFFAEADRLDSSGTPGSLAKGDTKKKKRKEREQKKKLFTKED
ncbi:GPI biosynthesis protein family Pig-F-domain-containing protein [Multifurca ochricompacta]|uniref:GPI biosynthesis protein family Pig-F-domain-containing protein n=1 Tax=Multifurca ochricompacta TaxID=376703 RepID=A0AAD4LWS0_9AGAM|nr:GPI biosynthesis protein family Pig-F-domain-containing protein [Multifurca ochricompacta]